MFLCLKAKINSQLMAVHLLYLPTLLLLLQHHYMGGIAKASVMNINTDRSSLMALKSHITYDPNKFIANNWSIETSVCQWIGVTCDSFHLRVTSLNLSYMGLGGTIPPHLGNLSFLTHFDLHNNSFHGSLPSELARLHRLKQIILTFNNFNGEIPSWFALLPKIEMLWLDGNSFSGHVKSFLFNITSLQSLELGLNDLWGFLPSNFFQAPALQFVNVYGNQISGSIPRTVSNISSLQTVNLGNNSFSGEVPENIFYYLPKLRWFGVYGNQFSGEIPLSLFSCKQLQILYLDYNNFRGNIPSEIRNLTMLRELYLSSNNLQGTIPNEIDNLTMLEELWLDENKLQGTIPNEIGNLHNLQFLVLQENDLIGTIPTEVFNISTIQVIALESNQLSGSLPSTLGSMAQNLEELYLGINYLSGKIPSFLSNASMLTALDLDVNSFSGDIPNVFSNLRKLRRLNLEYNKLTSDPELSIINSLATSKHLQFLRLSNNPLNSIFPMSIGNLSTSLVHLGLWRCGIRGRIPENIGNLSNLIDIDFGENKLTGNIGKGIGNLHKLQVLFLNANTLSGSLPSVICRFKSLWALDLGRNAFSGPIPSCMGNLTFLRKLSLTTNRFNKSIPSNLLSLTYLLSLDLSSNELSGLLPPDIANLKVVIEIDLSDNQLSGTIPNNIGSIQDLVNLSLAQNQVHGPIPESLGSLLGLEHLDLSKNHLSGIIPKSIEALIHLISFNVSFNKLEGEIPSGGTFKNFSALSFIGNEGLCGALRLQVPSCKANPSSKSQETRGIVWKIVLPVGIATILMLIFVYMLKWQKFNKPSNAEEDSTMTTWRRISYHELQRATNQFNEDNLLGTGYFGKVYKGILVDGINVAVKVFNLELQEGFRSFNLECEVLRNTRHRNLVKIISSCSNDIDFKALILSYMPNGNLERWLYSENSCLSIIQRVNIMIDVAAALDYLHYGCSTPIAHCDIKPSNILLDQDMVAHVTDFGIAKLLGGHSFTHTMTLATIGYMAPEYGLEGTISRQGDVYSYGILLMETFTGKKPTDEMFHGEFSIKRWVKDLFPDAMIDFIGGQLLIDDRRQLAAKKDCLLSIMGLALDCSAEFPNERGNMKDVLASLKKIRIKLLNEPRNRRASV